MLTINDAIVVTGSAGFIGSCLVGYLNEKGYENITVVDEFDRPDKFVNLDEKNFRTRLTVIISSDGLEKTMLMYVLFFIWGPEPTQLNSITAFTVN